MAPRGVGHILDTAFDILVARFGYLISATMFVWVPITIASKLILRSDLEGAGFFLQLGLALPSNALSVALVAPVVVAELLGQELPLSTVVRRAWSNLFSLIVVVVLSSLAAALFLCACFFPIVAGVWLFSLAPTVLLVEGGGPIQAMKRSVRLVLGWPSFGRWLGWMAVASLLFLPVNLTLALLDEPETRGVLADYTHLGGSILDVLVLVISSVFAALGNAYMSTCVAVYYVDCRVRKEAFDLEVALPVGADR